jgi:hypothetical protein
MIVQVFGVAAGLLSCVDAVPYVRDVLRGSTRPHRGTWCIWSVLSIAAFGYQLAGGAGWSLLMLGVQAASVTTVFALSIRYGVGGPGRFDLALGAVAAVGIVGWFVLSQPVVAAVCVVVADLAGVLLMLPKVWRDPRSETSLSFLLSGAAGLLGAAAVGSWQFGLLLYPAYFGGVNTAIGILIALRRRAVPAVDVVHLERVPQLAGSTTGGC